MKLLNVHNFVRIDPTQNPKIKISIFDVSTPQQSDKVMEKMLMAKIEKLVQEKQDIQTSNRSNMMSMNEKLSQCSNDITNLKEKIVEKEGIIEEMLDKEKDSD